MKIQKEIAFGMYASRAYPDLFVKHYGFVDDVILMEQCQTDLLHIWRGYASTGTSRTRTSRNELNLIREEIYV